LLGSPQPLAGKAAAVFSGPDGQLLAPYAAQPVVDRFGSIQHIEFTFFIYTGLVARNSHC
jgi:hypothetical protein